jgi:DNA processing protein
MTPLLRVILLLTASGGFPPSLWSSFIKEDLPPEAFLEEGPSLWERLGYSETVRDTLARLSETGWPEREEDRARQAGIRLVPFDCREYPGTLAGIPHAPMLLYVRGKWPLVGPSVAVVGTRKCSSYGWRTAAEIGRAAAGAGGVVISGGAAGIDGAAHEGCLDGGGGTIAVLGTGVDVVYPRGHERLFERIVEEGGALVAEYALGSPPRQWRFPERNRIIAGMADRLVVVEAPLKSGAMSTARHALEAGREVWAVPGRISEEGCAGSNRLIFDGAQPLVSVREFVSLAFGRQLGLFPPGGEREKTPLLTEKEQRILAVLKKYGERTVDNIAVECTMSPADVFSCLAVLAAEERVFPSGPGRWSAVPR